MLAPTESITQVGQQKDWNFGVVNLLMENKVHYIHNKMKENARKI